MAARQDLPKGDESDWREHYGSQVAHVTRHRRLASPRVSVVVVAYRAWPVVLECLDSLASQVGIAEDSLEIILVDNGCSLDSSRRLPSSVSLELKMRSNVGACSARNAGAAWAQAPLLAFVDDDGVVRADYVSRALVWFDNPEILGIRGRIVAHKHRYFSAIANHYDRGDLALDDCLVTEGNCLLRRAAFLQVGGFAETLSPYEGIELSYRLTSRFPHSRLCYVPDVILEHDYCDSWATFFRKRFFYAKWREDTELYPGFKEYIEKYRKTRFPVGYKRLDELLARLVLRQIGRLITRMGRYSTFQISPYANPSRNVSSRSGQEVPNKAS